MSFFNFFSSSCLPVAEKLQCCKKLSEATGEQNGCQGGNSSHPVIDMTSMNTILLCCAFRARETDACLWHNQQNQQNQPKSIKSSSRSPDRENPFGEYRAWKQRESEREAEARVEQQLLSNASRSVPYYRNALTSVSDSVSLPFPQPKVSRITLPVKLDKRLCEK